MTNSTEPATRAVRAALGSDRQHGAVVPPLHLTSTFRFARFAEKGEYDYTRTANPTRDALAEALVELEGGAGATVTASGMAAITLVCQLLRPGDRLLAPRDCYGGTYRLLTALAGRGDFDLRFADLADPDRLREAFDWAPRMVLVETPSNPLLRITDLRAMSALCERHDTLFVADNTFLSPAWQRPIALGADVVLHSTTKYLNGHSDVVGGALVAADAALHESLQWWANCLGLAGAPFDSYLTLRGLRTLYARARQHEENARALAELLDVHPRVRRVHYPGLASHPGHAVAARQQSGFGGMLSFELDGDGDDVAAFLAGLRHFFLAESLGGVESLVAHPATMTHAAMDPGARARAGITESLIRLSAGIEASADLVADVAAGLERVGRRTQRHVAVAAART